MHFEFLYPWYFLLLFPIICLFLCPLTRLKKYFVHLHFFTKTTNFIDKEKLLFTLILALFVSALATPISYEQKSPNNRKGRDLVIAIDSSGSMGESGYDKENPRERKFDSVIKVLAQFIAHRYDDNIGVVSFGDFAFSLSALTYDRTSLNFVLKFLDVGIAGENTAIGDGLMQSIRLLKDSKTQNKVIILLSDGYQNSGSHSAKEAVEKAKNKSIKIYTIGIGSSKDYDIALLKTIASQSGGAFFQAENLNEMKKIYSSIDELEPSPIRSQHYLHKTLLFDIPLFVAIVLLLFILIQRKRGLAL